MPAECRACGVRLFGDEVLKGICENCEAGGAIQQTPRTAAPSPVTQEPSSPRSYDEALPSWERSSPSDLRLRRSAEWEVFRAGLVLLCLVTVLGIASNTLIYLPPFGMPVEQLPAWAEQMYSVHRMVQIVSLILSLVALGLLCAVPKSSGLRGRAYAMIGSLVGMVVILLLVIVWWLALAAPPPQLPMLDLALFVALLVLAVCFLVCLVALLSGAARVLGDSDLATGIILYCVVAIVAGILVGILIYSMLDSAMRSADHRTAVNMVYSVFGIFLAVTWVFGVWFLTLMFRLRRLTREGGDSFSLSRD